MPGRSEHRFAAPDRGDAIGKAMLVAFLVVLGCGYFLPAFQPYHVGTAYITLHVVLSIIMIAVWRRRSISIHAIFWTGITARLLLAPVIPLTSNDAERYLWDGAVALGGFDPYQTSPDDLEGHRLRETWATPPEHAAYPTIYPPASLSLFALSASAGPVWSIYAWKALGAIASILSLCLMRSILEKRGLTRALSLFALSPLLLLETGLGAHLDIFVVLSICVTLLAVDRNRFALAGAAIGVGVAIKFLPIVMIAPVLWRRAIKQAVMLVAAAVAAIVFFYGGAMLLGMQPIGVIVTFFEKWRFGSPVFNTVEALAPPALTLPILIGVAISLVAVAAINIARDRALFAMMVLFATPLLLSSVVFPWYLCVLVPFVTLRPTATLLFWLSAAPTTYVVLNRWLSPEKSFDEATWPLILIATALIAGLIYDIAHNKKRSALIARPSDVSFNAVDKPSLAAR